MTQFVNCYFCSTLQEAAQQRFLTYPVVLFRFMYLYSLFQSKVNSGSLAYYRLNLRKELDTMVKEQTLQQRHYI